MRRLAASIRGCGVKPVTRQAAITRSVGVRSLTKGVRQGFRIVDVRTQEALVPAPHLDQVNDATDDSPDLGRRVVVRRTVGGQEDRLGASAQRGRQRDTGPDSEGPRLVRRSGHDLARSPRVAVATDDDGHAAQLWPAAHLDRCEELVEVDVQHPVARRHGAFERWFTMAHHHPRWHAHTSV